VRLGVVWSLWCSEECCGIVAQCNPNKDAIQGMVSNWAFSLERRRMWGPYIDYTKYYIVSKI